MPREALVVRSVGKKSEFWVFFFGNLGKDTCFFLGNFGLDFMISLFVLFLFAFFAGKIFVDAISMNDETESIQLELEVFFPFGEGGVSS